MFIDAGSIAFQYISCYCLSLRETSADRKEHISIHLMLLFISLVGSRMILFLNFNTSHVTVYLDGFKRIGLNAEFQYISCYCLSDLRSNDFPCEVYFNTSHVTVYPIGVSFRKSSVAFQYISCYCLSHRCLIPQILCSISIHLMLLFIWEKSCESVAFSHISIHLMLLFIVRLMNTIT